MHIDATEKKWVILVLVMTAVVIGIIAGYAVEFNIHPPSNVEPIDSTALHLSDEFNEDNIGVKTDASGTVVVTMVAARYGFFPQDITVPANTPVKIRIASADVLHGIHTPETNFNTMVVPGYVSELHTTFPKAGDYPMFCNEYCGFGHDFMWARLHVVAKDQFKN